MNLLGIVLIVVMLVAVFVPIGVRVWELYRLRKRETMEDALKILWDCAERHMPATAEALAGRLHLSLRATLRLIQKMSERGLVRFEGNEVCLTPTGRALALHVLRAHRLWERYLADNTAVPLTKVHQMADKAEHYLTPADVRRLDADLGYPRRDPHGDLIPRPEEDAIPRIGTPLTDWPVGKPARIVHIEDEPETIFAQILAEGLTPGTDVVVVERLPEGIHLRADDNDIWLASILAGHIHVIPAPEEAPSEKVAMTLADVPEGTPVRVVGLSPQLRGLLRRRLLDLGFTRGAVIVPVLHSSFGRGDPRAYRVRGTLIALRQDQAKHIFVEPLETGKEENKHEFAYQASNAKHAHSRM